MKSNMINIAEILKDCPSGMELDCTLLEDLEFDGIVDSKYIPIRCRVKNPNGGYYVYNFTKYGCWFNTTFAKCAIFPKGKTTWEGFVPPCKFKVGDRVRHKNNHNVVFTITSIEEDYYACGVATAFWFDDQDDYELVPNKFDITTLKPFDKVLVRNYEYEVWEPNFFSKYVKIINKYKIIGVSNTSGGEDKNFGNYCIPYEGNEHLLYTDNDCDDFYKTWE